MLWAVHCEFLWQFLGASFVDFSWKDLSEATENYLPRAATRAQPPCIIQEVAGQYLTVSV